MLRRRRRADAGPEYRDRRTAGSTHRWGDRAAGQDLPCAWVGAELGTGLARRTVLAVHARARRRRAAGAPRVTLETSARSALLEGRQRRHHGQQVVLALRCAA